MPHSTRLLRLPEVMERTGFSRASIYRLGKLGKFPAQVRIGPNTAAWVESEVEQFIADRIGERDTAAA